MRNERKSVKILAGRQACQIAWGFGDEDWYEGFWIMLLEKAENFFILGKLLSLVPSTSTALAFFGLYLNQMRRPWGKIFGDGKSWF